MMCGGRWGDVWTGSIVICSGHLVKSCPATQSTIWYLSEQQKLPHVICTKPLIVLCSFVHQ